MEKLIDKEDDNHLHHFENHQLQNQILNLKEEEDSLMKVSPSTINRSHHVHQSHFLNNHHVGDKNFNTSSINTNSEQQSKLFDNSKENEKEEEKENELNDDEKNFNVQKNKNDQNDITESKLDIQMLNEENNEKEENNVFQVENEITDSNLDLEESHMDDENIECIKRRKRLDKRRLNHLNKRIEIQNSNKHFKKNSLNPNDDSNDDEDDSEELEDIDNLEKDENKNQSLNIVDLLTKNRTNLYDNEEDQNPENEDDKLAADENINKAAAFLEFHNLMQLIQQNSSNNLEDTLSTSKNETIEESKDWLLNAATSQNFSLEKLQTDTIARQSPASLQQQLMFIQLLQQFQQQAANNSSNTDDEDNSRVDNQFSNETKKLTGSLNESMDCDQQSKNIFNNSGLDNNKSKFSFGNLATDTLIGSSSAPVPTKPAHILNSITSKNSFFSNNAATSITTAKNDQSTNLMSPKISINGSANTLSSLLSTYSSSIQPKLIGPNSSIKCNNEQLNRLSSKNLDSSSSSNLLRQPPINNLILMPDESATGEEQKPTSTNPLELLQHTAEKALQKTMKGASFLVNSNENEEGEGKLDDPSNRHRCRFCDKIFGSDSALQIHIRSHTGERPFKCNVCGNRFSTKGNLKVHFSRHKDKYPDVKMNSLKIPEHMDKIFPILEPPGSSQSPPPQYQPEDDLFAAVANSVNGIGSQLNFAQGLAAAAAASQQHSLQQQQQLKQRHIQDFNMLAGLSAEAFSREILLANSGNYLLKNSNPMSLSEKQLRDLTLASKSPAAATKQETSELEDSSIADSMLDYKQKKTNDSMDVSLKESKPLSSAINSNLNSSSSTRKLTSPIFGQLNSSKENDSGDETNNQLNMMLDYLLKAKRKTNSTGSSSELDVTSPEKSNVQSLLSELNQQQLDPNLTAAAAAAAAAAGLFSFLPSNLQPNIYQHLPAYLSNLIQSQIPFQNLQLNNSTDTSKNSPSTNNLMKVSNQTNSITTEKTDDESVLATSQNKKESSPNHRSSSPQTILGVLNNLKNQGMGRSINGGRNSPNSSMNSIHEFDLNSVLSSSPRASPSIRQQISQLTALTGTASSTATSHLMNSPASLSLANSTPNSCQNGQIATGLNSYQDLLPKPGSTDNAWETLMEIEKDSETAKLKKLVENSDQQISDPNQCIICQRILSCKSALQMHYRTHTGERPFKCRLCQRAFTTKGNLKTHMSVHRQKPSLRSVHECPVCKHPFTNALVLQQHVKQQHNQPDERQLVQAHQKAQQQLQYAAAMERMFLATNPQKNENDRDFNNLKNNLQEGSFFSSLQSSFDLSKIKNFQSSMNDDKSFNDENDSECNYQNSKFFDNKNNSLTEDEDLDEKDQSKDLKEDNDQLDCEDNEEEKTENYDLNEDDENEDEENQKIKYSKTDSNSSLFQSHQNTENLENMNEDSMVSTISSTSGALDLTPKQQQVVAAHLQQLKNNQIISSNQLNTSLNNHPGQLLNIPNLPSFQVSARGANTTCKICMKTFACNSALEIHYRSHTKERPFKCTICERGFSTKGNMKQHMLTHKIRDFPPNMFNTSGCVSGDNRFSNLVLGAAAAAAAAVNASKATDLNGLKEKLDLAGVLNSANGLGENCLIKSNNSMTSSKSRSSIANYSIHQNGDYQSDGSEADKEDRRSVISSNGVQISNGVSRLSNTSETNFLNNDLRRIGNITNNVRSNFLASLNNASGASTSTGSKVDLKHMCEICDKPFSSHSALQIHTRTHTGDKPYKCNVCERAFTTKGNLKVHMGTHYWGNPQSRRGRKILIY